jgi:NTP pyrophosphatase (non-canonical NTP hydrolase)
MKISDFQALIHDQYFDKDNGRGLDATFIWFVEEVGELARALKSDDPQNLREEFADVLAWLASMASIKGINLEQAAIDKYGKGCPRCLNTPCDCAHRENP